MVSRLASLAVLAMLTFVSLATPVSAQSATLTPDLLSKMLDLIARKGSDVDMPPLIANPLGLTSAHQSWASHQFTTEKPLGVFHGVFVSRGNDRDFVITNRINSHTVNILRSFRVQHDGTLVTAVVYNVNARQFVVLDRGEAQKELDAEFAFWAAALADSPN